MCIRDSIKANQVLPMTVLFERYGLTKKLKKWQDMERKFMIRLRKEEELMQYHNKVRADYNVISSNPVSYTHLDVYKRQIPHPTVFVRKSVYEKYGAFDLNYSIVADYEMIFRFYLLGVKFRYIDRVITNFRQGGLTTKRQLACAQEVKKVSMKYLDRSPDAKREEYLQLIKNNYRCV